MKTDSFEDLKALIANVSTPEKFKPFAYYDKHLDCIRVQLIDCSFTEERKNRFITTLKANHMSDEAAGFNIKGVRYLFEQLGLGVTGVHMLTTIIDKMVQIYPDAALERVKRDYLPSIREENLSVNFA